MPGASLHLRTSEDLSSAVLLVLASSKQMGRLGQKGATDAIPEQDQNDRKGAVGSTTTNTTRNNPCLPGSPPATSALLLTVQGILSLH